MEVFGGGGAFPFKVVESSRRSRSFIKSSIQEYRRLAIEMVHFWYSKGEPLWVRTFNGANRCLLLELRRM